LVKEVNLRGSLRVGGFSFTHWQILSLLFIFGFFSFLFCLIFFPYAVLSCFAVVLALFEVLDDLKVEEVVLLTLILILLLKLGLQANGNCSRGIMAQGLLGIVLRGVEGIGGGLNNSQGAFTPSTLTSKFDSLVSVELVGIFALASVIDGPDMLRED
jgi:hypothetical protein